MIFGVVFCHFIDALYLSWEDDPVTRYPYYFFCLFLMPVFIFVSGYFSKKSDSDEYYRKTISNCLIPYLLFDFIYGLFEFNGSVWGSAAAILYPRWTLWFLLSLFMWRIMVKPVSLIRGAFWLSVLFSLFVGFTEMGVFMSLSRTFGFFPFFLAGYLIPEQYIEKVRKMNKWNAAFALAFAVGSLFVIQSLEVDISALHMILPYEDTSSFVQAGERLLILVTGFVCIAGFVLVISDKKSIISMIGKNSIVIYLFHSRLLRVLMKIFPDNISNGLICIGLAAVFSVTVCLLLGNEYSARVYHTVMNFITGLFVKNSSQRKTA